MTKSIKWVIMTGLLLVLVFVVGKVEWKQQHQLRTASVPMAPQLGYRMPPFVLTAYPTNQTINTDKLVGKPIFINFWASWCPPCRAETPEIVNMYKKYGDKVVFLSVNLTSQDRLQNVEKFIQHYDITWPVALDNRGIVMQKYNVVGFPTSFFVNRQGVITDVNVGLISAGNLNTQLQRIAQ